MPVRTLSRLLILPLLLWAGCSSAPSPKLDKIIALLNHQQEQIQWLQEQVNDGLTLALCNPELRQLLEDVQKECSTSGGICTTKQIKPAVIAADPEHRGRFLKMMSHLPHEVLYMGKDAADVDPDRTQRLSKLVRRALLKSTVFLVVSSPEVNEAEAIRRAEIVERMLLSAKVPHAKIKRWIYAYPANKLDILRTSDQPSIGETKEISRGVWVFRADC